MTHATTLRIVLVVIITVWGVWSLARIAPLDRTDPPETGSGILVTFAVPGIAFFALAAWRYLVLARARESALLLAISASWVLLAEAMFAATVARNWHASWWEWHLLMLTAFGIIAWSAQRSPIPSASASCTSTRSPSGNREVSVLFADLEGFTSFSESHPPAAVQDMLNVFFEVVLPAVRVEGGHVEQFAGDSVMVTFNVVTEQPTTTPGRRVRRWRSSPRRARLPRPTPIGRASESG